MSNHDSGTAWGDDSETRSATEPNEPESDDVMDDAQILWAAVVEVCGGNVQSEIKAAYRRIAEARREG